MSDKAKQLLDQALALSEAERADIAGALIESLEPAADADVEVAWRREVARRVAALDSGTARTVPWSEVRDQLFSRLSGER
jgi:putative addiction module component (TIGR02574 family)